MFANRHLGSMFLASSVILTSWCIGGVAKAADFTLTSSAFKDGAPIPIKYAGKIESNANCVGENVSPAFSWSNVPAGTKSFALIMSDPQGRAGTGLFQWVAYGIPGSLTGLAEGEGSQASDKIVVGKSSVERAPFYFGPCASPGPPHHYFFILIANDLDPKALQPGLTRDELMAALKGRVKGVTALVGLYAKP